MTGLTIWHSTKLSAKIISVRLGTSQKVTHSWEPGGTARREGKGRSSMGDSKIGDLSSDGDGRRSVADPSTDVEIPDEARSALVHTKVTCPFLGPAVAMERLPVRNDVANPLAVIEELRRMGNSGRVDLGSGLSSFA